MRKVSSPETIAAWIDGGLSGAGLELAQELGQPHFETSSLPRYGHPSHSRSSQREVIEPALPVWRSLHTIISVRAPCRQSRHIAGRNQQLAHASAVAKRRKLPRYRKREAR